MKAEMEIIWDDHLKTISNLFNVLYNDSALVDVTLSCQGGFLRAHKLVLSACSPYFHQVFRENPCKHPTIVLRSVCYEDMAKLLEYMYRGTINIRTDHFEEIMHVANDLKIKGFEMYRKKIVDGSEEDVSEEYKNEINVPENKPNRDTAFKGQKRVQFEYAPEPEMETEKYHSSVHEDRIHIRKSAIPTNEELEDDMQMKPEHPHHIEHEAALSTSENEDDEENEDKSNKESTDNSGNSKIVTLFECDVCGGRFKSRKDVQKHKKIHQDKSFSCEFCNKKFSRASHLIRHRRVHTGERPFICDTCGKDFARQDKLKLHIRTSHNNNIDKDINPDEIRIGTVDNKKYVDDDSESEPSEHITLENLLVNSNTNTSSAQKRGRGRPRKYPLLPPKRTRTHSKDDSYEDNYDITSLPYGDLNYLTMPYEQGSTVIEPLVEIRTDNTNAETPPESESTSKSTEQETEAKEDQVLITIAKIGECTISLN